MDEEQNSVGKVAKVTLKSFSKGIIIILIILFIVFFSIAGTYVISKDAFAAVSEKNSTYSTHIDANGNIVYEYTNPDDESETKVVTPEEMAEDLKSELGQFINGDDEEYKKIVKYFIEAETVTKQPYIDSRPEGELNGQIKFYRYTEGEAEVNAEDVKEENRLKYMALADFNAKLEAYKINAVANQDIYKYFTIDENGAVLIACGSEEYREINTGVDGKAKDRDLTVDIINQETTAAGSYSGNSDSGFKSSEFTIFTKQIDYLPLVERYIMPSNLLYALLVQTADQDFVTAIADLAYQNEIAIGIYDNKSHSESIETYTYKKLMKMDVITTLNFKEPLVSITSSQPSIKLKTSDLQSLPYEYIPIRCETQTIVDGNEDEKAKTKHFVIYKKEGYKGETIQDNKMYINGTNASNEITGLGDGATYKTIYKRKTDSMSTPTIGVLLADTWVAKWEALYGREENSTPGDSSPETDLENKEITTYNSGNILSAFSENFRNNISEKLKTHAQDLRKQAINKIIEATPNSIYEAEAQAAEEVTFDDNDKKAVLAQHLAECSSCNDAVVHAGYDPANIDSTYDAIMNAVSGALLSVKPHYEADWNKYVEAKKAEEQAEVQANAVQTKNKRKEEFKKQLNAADTIKYSTNISGNKQYVETKFSSSSSSNFSKYKRSETTTRSKERRKILRSI